LAVDDRALKADLVTFLVTYFVVYFKAYYAKGLDAHNAALYKLVELGLDYFLDTLF